MIVIGEKINGSIPSVAEAIAKRDAELIRQRAKRQADAGASYIDVCASVPGMEEVEVLRWLIEQVQSVTDLPVCIDSPSPHSCVEAMKFCQKPGIINSVSGESGKMETIFPAIAETEWQCIALLCAKGIPSTAEERLSVFHLVMEKAKEYEIAPERLYIDPLVEMLCTAEDGIRMITDVIRTIKEESPRIHIAGAASNVSFNLPARKLLNQAFTVLAMNAGMDAAVLDPTNRDLMGMIYATEAMLGLDDYCMEYISAYRRGIFGPAKG